MNLAARLLKAREVLAGGWSEPMPRTASGEWTHARSEDATRFDVLSALDLAASTPTETADAYLLLESMVCPGIQALDQAAITGGVGLTDELVALLGAAAGRGHQSLHEWLEYPERTQAHVLALFDKALSRAKAQEAE